MMMMLIRRSTLMRNSISLPMNPTFRFVATTATETVIKKAKPVKKIKGKPVATSTTTATMNTNDDSVSSNKMDDETTKSIPAKSSEEEEKQLKQDALEVAIKKLNKQFGTGAVSLIGERKFGALPVISTGILTVDDAIGCGGLPLGRIIEIFGPEASGKHRKLALSTIAEAQRLGQKCTFVDAEHALDADYARGMGVNLDNLYISQPDSGEDALEIVDTLVRSNAMSVIVVDSVSALVPRAEIEGEMGDEKIGVQARLMSRALRKLTPSVAKSNTVLIFINQIRHKVVTFGNPETTSGGQALKFYASVRIDVRKKSIIKGPGDENIGTLHNVKVVKNKVGPPFRTAEFRLEFGKGIDRLSNLLDSAINQGIIYTKGAYYYLKEPLIVKEETTLGRGRQGAYDLLKTDAALLTNLSNFLRTKRLSVQGSPVSDADELEEILEKHPENMDKK